MRVRCLYANATSTEAFANLKWTANPVIGPVCSYACGLWHTCLVGLEFKIDPSSNLIVSFVLSLCTISRFVGRQKLVCISECVRVSVWLKMHSPQLAQRPRPTETDTFLCAHLHECPALAHLHELYLAAASTAT